MDVQKVFNQKYKNNPQAFGDKSLPIMENSLEYISTGEALLIGIGNGRNVPLLLKNNFKITGIDISQEGLSLLREKYQNENNLKLIQGNILETDFTEKFDLVSAIGVLHFMELKDIQKMIQKMQQLTKKNGINVIAVRMTQNMMNNLPHIFSSQELNSFYQIDGWKIQIYNEKEVGDRKVATIIAQKLVD